jgi:Tetratricopeptide repeat
MLTMKILKIAFCTLSLTLLFGAPSRADSYDTFRTKRFYSANHRYFVLVTPAKQAMLYQSKRQPRKLWSTNLPELPAHLFVSDDGNRVVMIDHYYGNGRRPNASVVLFLGEDGRAFARHTLGEVANLSLVPQTTSSAHWLYGALFSPDQSAIIIETIARNCEPSSLQLKIDLPSQETCLAGEPYEELRFSMATGQIISRSKIQGKYNAGEKRLLHELELVESEHPSDNLNHVYAFLRLASFYGSQKQYARARDFYEKALPIYEKQLGATDASVADAMTEAATNYRNMRAFGRAEQLYRRALQGLDKDRADPEAVSPVAITTYEEYAILLRLMNRPQKAQQMEARAKVLRAVYPDYRATID